MPVRPNLLKQRLGSGQVACGTMIFEFLAPGLPAALVASGADFVIYDMEHSGFSISQMKDQFALARGLDIVPMVRPPTKDYSSVTRLLDLGAMGFLLQMSESPAEIEQIASWTRYPPAGRRGAMFGGAHDDYAPGPLDEKMRQADARTLIMPLVETRRGIEAVDEIASLPEVDAVHLGQFDLTLSMGIPGQFDHPDFLRAVDRLLAACERHGKAAACMAVDLATLLAWRRRGFSIISCSFDIALLQTSLGGLISAVRAMPADAAQGVGQ
jgi:2-keto-3-deoxy-L-rhamnonate aldolase RhmA